jgi:excinuclease ABC subunit C
LLRELPESPAVYLFKDDRGAVLYAGQSRNIRHRLGAYRNAGRRKAHRKMRQLVSAASALEVRLQPTPRDALLVENELIRTLRPPYNVEGAFAFLYPAIGVVRDRDTLLLGFSTSPDDWSELGFEWFGVFRSRRRARDAFDALVSLLAWVGHPEPRSRLPAVPRPRGSRLVALRRIDPSLDEAVAALLRGESPELLSDLALRLLERSSARLEAERVQEALGIVAHFHVTDAVALRDALIATARQPGFVAQHERDALFIAARDALRAEPFR